MENENKEIEKMMEITEKFEFFSMNFEFSFSCFLIFFRLNYFSFGFVC